MGDHHQRAGIARQPILDPQHGIKIKVVGRLIKQQQIAATHQRLRQVQAHPPAAGEGGHRAALHLVFKTQTGQQFRRARGRCIAADMLHLFVQMGKDFTVFCRIGVRHPGLGVERGLDAAQLGVAVQRIVKRGRLRRRRFLRNVRNHPAVGHGNVAALSGQQPTQRREQRGFASAIRADDADLTARVDSKGGTLDQRHGALGES